jgi:hypothetical protein
MAIVSGSMPMNFQRTKKAKKPVMMMGKVEKTKATKQLKKNAGYINKMVHRGE